MKKISLFVLALFASLMTFAQFNFGEGQSSDISKISPDKTIPVKDIIPDLNSEVTAVPQMKGMLSCTIEFYNSSSLSKISECSDKINGMPTSGYFLENNTKYLFTTFDKDLKSWVFQQVEVATGKTLSKVKIQAPSPMSMINSGSFNTSKTEFIYIGDTKTKTSDTSIAVISVSTGEILRKFGLTKTRVNKLAAKILSDKRLVCALTPDKKNKIVTENSSSNLVICDLETGLFTDFKNSFFKDNKNNPKEIYYDGLNTVYVTYNDAKPLTVAYDINTLNAIAEIKDLGTPQCNTKEGKFVFGVSEKSITVYNVEEKKIVKSFSDDTEIPVPYSKLKILSDGQNLSANRVGYYQYGLDAKDHISIWSIEKLTK